MSGIKFTNELKHEAITQVVDRGYTVPGMSERLGLSTKPLYTWQAQFSRPRKELRAIHYDVNAIFTFSRAGLNFE